MGIHARVPWRAPPQSGEVARLSFPTGSPSRGVVVPDPDGVSLVGHLGVRQGIRRSQAVVILGGSRSS
jgi:streptogramin lyase